jgi:amino-acid N-acetyltransferase
VRSAALPVLGDVVAVVPSVAPSARRQGLRLVADVDPPAAAVDATAGPHIAAAVGAHIGVAASAYVDAAAGPSIGAAVVADAPALHALMAKYVARGLLLPRTVAAIAAHIDDYVVARHDDRIIGCAALRQYAGGLAEIGALAVAEDRHGAGVGRRLVETLVAAARERGLQRVFALTLQDGFFHRLGFETVQVSELPQKIARDCAACPRRHRCDEIAVSLWLTAAPGPALSDQPGAVSGEHGAGPRAAPAGLSARHPDRHQPSTPQEFPCPTP